MFNYVLIKTVFYHLTIPGIKWNISFFIYWWGDWTCALLSCIWKSILYISLKNCKASSSSMLNFLSVSMWIPKDWLSQNCCDSSEFCMAIWCASDITFRMETVPWITHPNILSRATIPLFILLILPVTIPPVIISFNKNPKLSMVCLTPPVPSCF